MKKLLLIFFSILLTFTFAIAQDGINYQGAATDANGDELTSQSISIRASVLSGGASGNLEWEETHSTTTDQFGLFNIVIGQGTSTTNGATANFDDMDWGSGNHFLKIEMDASGGTNYAMIGTTQMMSVPYALYAKSAGIDSTMLANMIGSSGGGMGGGGSFGIADTLDMYFYTAHLNNYTDTFTATSDGFLWGSVKMYESSGNIEINVDDVVVTKMRTGGVSTTALTPDRKSFCIPIKQGQSFYAYGDNIGGSNFEHVFFTPLVGGGGSSSSASSVDSAMVAGMIANAGGGGSFGDWELLHDLVRDGCQGMPGSWVPRDTGQVNSDGFLYLIHDFAGYPWAQLHTGDSITNLSVTSTLSGNSGNIAPETRLIPVKKGTYWSVVYNCGSQFNFSLYFIPAGGGSSSSSTGTMSVSTFGDTLTMNGQSIIIPGVSYQNYIPTFSSVTDYDGNTYSTTDYGAAGEWMTENLRVTKFSNGDPINIAIFNYNGGNLSNTSNQTGQYANYFTHSYHDASGNGSPQIFFYNGFAMEDSRNVCPSGWHVPTRSEWIQLLELFGNEDTDINTYWNNIPVVWNESGSALKDTDYWGSALTYSTNYSYMSIYPTGMTDPIHGGSNYGQNSQANIWSSTPTGFTTSYSAGHWQLYLLDSTFDAVFENKGLLEFGCIRCKKD